MDFIHLIQTIIDLALNITFSISFIFCIIILIILYHLLSFFFRDQDYLKALQKYNDSEEIELDTLKDLPLINIIIPAWKEGKMFNDCLLSIKSLKYPNLKVIINAGGNSETIKIADAFKNNKNYVILRQKPLGKMRAINDCLGHISEGIIYSIDADVILIDDIFLRMIYPIINKKEYVTVGSVRPLKNQEKNQIVKYILINRNSDFNIKYSRYGKKIISGPNTCFKYEVLTKIGKFYNDNLHLASDRFRGSLIVSKGFKIYRLNNYSGRIYTYYPNSFKEYIFQESRWRKNSLTNPYIENRKKLIFKFIISVFLTFFLIILPFLFFINFGLLLFSLIILFNKYLKKIRKILFFKLSIPREYYQNFGLQFYFFIILSILIDEIITLFLGLDLFIHTIKNFFNFNKKKKIKGMS